MTVSPNVLTPMLDKIAVNLSKQGFDKLFCLVAMAVLIGKELLLNISIINQAAELEGLNEIHGVFLSVCTAMWLCPELVHLKSMGSHIPADNNCQEDVMETQESKWTRYAEVYDKRRFSLMPGYSDMLNAMIQAIPFDFNHTFNILDVGMGTGNLSEYILSRFPYAKLTGIDVSEGMLNIAGARLRKFGDRVVLQQRDLEETRIQGSWDVITSSLAFRCLTRERKHTFVKEIYEALGPNGVTIHADVLLVPEGFMSKQNKVNWDRTKQNALINGLITENELLEEEERRKAYETGTHKTLDDFLNREQFLAFFRDNGFRGADFVWQYWGLSVIAAQKEQ